MTGIAALAGLLWLAAPTAVLAQSSDLPPASTAPAAAPAPRTAQSCIPELRSAMDGLEELIGRLKDFAPRYQNPLTIREIAPERQRLRDEIGRRLDDFRALEKEFNTLREAEDLANAFGVMNRLQKGSSLFDDPAVRNTLNQRKISREASTLRRSCEEILASDDLQFKDAMRLPRLFVIVSATIVLLLALLAAASAVAVRTVRAKARLETQISKLAGAARRVGQGDLSVEVPVLASNELGALARQFNTMVGQLRILDEMKDEFVASVSHDLRSPMAAIKTTLDFMLYDDPHREKIPPHHRRMLEGLTESATRLDVFVSNILDTAKMKAGRMEYHARPVLLGPLVGRLESLYEAAARKKEVSLALAVASDLPAIQADPERLERVLTNLLSNALKFTRSGGTVTLGARRMDDAAEIFVEDTGKGIAKEDLPRLFKKFEQADAAGQKSAGITGTGLGLNIVKEAVEAMGGTVAVTSEPGKGTRFSLRLPLAAASAPEPLGPAASAPGPPGPAAPAEAAESREAVLSARVLVVDDDLAFSETSKQMLEASGYLVSVVNHGDKAAGTAAAEKPDLILCDMELGDMLGTEVIRRLKLEPATRGIPVILCSATKNASEVRAALDAGAVCFLPKPVKSAELALRIREVLNSAAGVRGG